MHKVQGFLIQLVFWCIRLIPVRLTGAMGAGIGRCLFFILTRHRNITLRNLARIYPEKTRPWRKHIACESFAELGRSLFEMPHVLLRSEDFLKSHVRVEGEDAFRAAVARGNGVFLAASHHGNWELGGLMLSVLGYAPQVIYTPLRQPYFDSIFLKGRQRFGARFSSRLAGLRWLPKSLKNGDVIAIMIDQHMSQGIHVPFLGHMAMTTALPAPFILRHQTPTFGVALERIGTSFQFKLRFWHIDMPKTSENKQADTYHIMQIINESFAPVIHQRPEMWLWLHRRWLMLEQDVEISEVVHGTP